MGHSILKIQKDDKELYLIWSSIVDGPVTVGLTFDEMKTELIKRYGQNGWDFTFKQMLNNAKEFGASSREDPASFIYCNRAGANESELTLDEISEVFCDWEKSQQPKLSQIDQLRAILAASIAGARERQKQRVWSDSENHEVWTKEIYEADKALLAAGEILSGQIESEGQG